MFTQRTVSSIRMSLMGATMMLACTPQPGGAPAVQALGPSPDEEARDDAGRSDATAEGSEDDRPREAASDAIETAAAVAQRSAEVLVDTTNAHWPDALERLAGAHEGASVEEIETATGQPAGAVAFTWSARGFVTGAFAPLLRIPVDAAVGPAPLERARSFLSEHGSMFGLDDPSRSLERVESRRAEGRTVFHFLQSANGLEVFDSAMLVHVRDDGDISWVLARVSPDAAIPAARPALTAAEAQEVSGMDDAALDDGPGASVLLGYYDPLLMGHPDGVVSLAWRVLEGNHVAYVDAMHGDVLGQAELTERDMHREILRCSGSCAATDVPGSLAWDDVCHRETISHLDLCTGGPAVPQLCQGAVTCSTTLYCDPATWCQESSLAADAVVARDAAGDFYNYLLVRHSRDSWDGVPGHQMRVTTKADGWTGPPDGTPDPPIGACDAQWDDAGFGAAANQVVLGSLRNCRDVVAHEFVHGLDQVTSPMSGNFCSHTRAIEEAFGDVFGEYSERFATGATDWVHGTGCPACATARNSSLVTPANFAPTCIWGNPASGGCGAYFDLQETFVVPGPSLPQPDSWSGYRGECGSYWNMTIASHIGWAMGREAAAGSATLHGIPVSGLGEADASHVWYRALVNDLAVSPTFTDLRNALIMECTGSADFTNCSLAVMSSGLWPGDTSLGLTVGNTGAFMSGAVDFASHPLPSPTRRYAFFQANNGDISYRFRTCAIGSTSCSWGSETLLEAGPMPLQRPSATTVGGVMTVCLVQFSNGVYCDRWNGTSWTLGPDIGSSGISGSVSIAHFNDALFIVYRRSTGLYWRSVADGASPYVWGAENLLYLGTSGTDGAVLASSDEDVGVAGGGNEMFVAWGWGGAGGTPAGSITYSRFLPTGPGMGSWSSTRILSRYLNATLLPYQTQHPLSLAFYRGRLHLVTTEADLDTMPRADSLWYGSCAPPCAAPDAAGSGDWTPFVRQEGTADAAALIDGWGPYDGWLHLPHQLSAGHLLYDRTKLSD